MPVANVKTELSAVNTQVRLDRLRAQVSDVFNGIRPILDGLQAEMHDIEAELRAVLSPQLVRQNQELQDKVTTLKSLVQQSINDLKGMASMHASEYAARRAKELTDILGAL